MERRTRWPPQKSSSGWSPQEAEFRQWEGNGCGEAGQSLARLTAGMGPLSKEASGFLAISFPDGGVFLRLSLSVLKEQNEEPGESD